MSNERKTEDLVRTALRKLGYYTEENTLRVEEQKSEIEAIKRLLRNASKTRKGGKGSPEFIITTTDNPDFVAIIECKGNTSHHESAKRDEPTKYAVDGVLHYAHFLAREFNVIAIAASGETSSSLTISTFLHVKKADQPQELKTKHGAEIAEPLPWADYIEHATFDSSVQKLRLDELMAFSRELHDFMRDHAKLTESEKPLMVSGTLIALQNTAFTKSYDAYKPDELQQQWLKVIRDEIDKAELPQAKKLNMAQPYSTIAVHPELGKATKKYPRGVLYELIQRLDQKVRPFVSVYHDFDVVGQFYGEFLKYTGGDKKALGIVLTPRHVTDLFARLANVNKSSRVLDICAGTAGFLISAMHLMMKDAVKNSEKKKIKTSGLIGVEQQPNMYALAASNMILRGDGKANLYQGSCFTPAIVKEIKSRRCDVGMLNPPYAQGDADLHELVFVKQMLDCLRAKATGIAIVPMNCAIAPHKVREELMKHHTLEAVMSMPDELFYPVGTVVCIMVWTAHLPHAKSRRKTWFGYWKNDGFIKTKHKGRVDPSRHWPAIRDRWVSSFLNREVHPGESVMHAVGPKDEWCAEAFMETDYSLLGPQSFDEVVKNYAVYRLLGLQAPLTEEEDADNGE
jgi:type I restriction enzyme M protein